MSDFREFHSVAEASEWGQKWFSGWSKQQKETGSLTYQFIQHYTGGSHHMYHKAAKSGCQFEGESSFVHREFCAAARELQSISSPENIVCIARRKSWLFANWLTAALEEGSYLRTRALSVHHCFGVVADQIIHKCITWRF